jgi:hypothetical protein
MTVRQTETGIIELLGDCTIEDADHLLQLLLAEPAATVDWTSCQSAHTAVVQVLLASRRTLIGSPQGEFLRNMVKPAFDRLRSEVRPSRNAAEMRDSGLM